MAFKIGDRLILQSQLTAIDQTEIEAGTVSTVLSFLSDEMVIVRYGFDKETDNEKVIGVPVSLLRTPSVDELEMADIEYENIVSKNFHVGRKFITGPTISFKDVEPNTVGTIVGIMVAENEAQDSLKFDFGKEEIHELTRDFVENNFFNYIGELEENLGDEIIVTGAEKNFHIIGAKVFAEDTGEIVIIIAKSQDEDNLFLVETLNGIQVAYKKEYLKPITSPELLYSMRPNEVVQKVCLHGKGFKANENISKHILLKDEFKPNDVVRIIDIDSININAYEDTFIVKRTGMDELKLSYAELRSYFTPFNGIVKDVTNTGKVEEVVSKEYEIGKAVIENLEIDSYGAVNPNYEDNQKTKPMIEIHDITINGVNFKINNGVIDIALNTIRTDEIDRVVEALVILKEYV